MSAPKGGSLLDLGCGTGQSSMLLNSRGFDVTGVDGSERFIAMAKKDRQSDKYICCQAESLPFAAQSFYCVASYNVIEHLIEPLKVVREVYRVLRPGGIFIIHSPNLLSIQHPINALRHFHGLTYDGRKNLSQLFLMAAKNSWRLLWRRLSKRSRLIYRQPAAVFTFPDVDATWLMNPLDTKYLLEENGFKVIRYQNLDSLVKPAWLKRVASALVPEQMGIIRIVAKKI